MPIPLIVYAGVAVGTAIAGGMMQSGSTRYNAANARNAAMLNAQSVFDAGRHNASMIGLTGALNAAASMAAARASAGAIAAVAGYNAQIQHDVTLYNDTLMEYEEDLLFRAYKLDKFHLANQEKTATGEVIAFQAASGTVIGEGSNADVVISQKTQFELDQTILRNNFDIASSKIYNARMKGLYEGELMVNKVLYEGQVGASAAMAQGSINAAAAKAGAGLEAWSTRYNAGSQAQSILNQGYAGYQTGMNTASSQLWGSVIQGIGNGASMYMGARYTQPGTSLATE